MVRKSEVRGVPLASFLGCPSALRFTFWLFFFPLSFPPGSSDEDEDEDGVSATNFLKKKSEAPSGESRKFLKKVEVRDRVRVRDGLPSMDHS